MKETRISKAKKMLACVLAVLLLCMVTSTNVFAQRFQMLSSYYMNIFGTEGSALQGRRLTLYNNGTGKDQQFIFVIHKGEYVLCAAQDVAYAVNYDTGTNTRGRAIMWFLGTGLGDSKLVSKSKKWIQTQRYLGAYLGAENVAQHAKIVWGGMYTNWV